MKWHLDPSGRLATTDMGQKLGVVPLLGELDSHLTQYVACAEAYLHTSWHLDIGRTVLANVDVRYMLSLVRLSVCLSVCRLSSACNARAPYSGG